MLTFQKYKDANAQWRWRLIAGNGKIIAVSGEGYYNEADCDGAITKVKQSAGAQVQRV